MTTKSQKPALPDIGDELAPKKPRLDLKALRPKAILEDETIESNSRVLGAEWGASTSIQAATTPQEEKPPPTPVASLRLEVPAYLDNELRLKAAADGVTKQYLVMQALAAAGFAVRPEDLVTDRRKQRNKM
jgi:hypothetical protein